MFSGKIHRGRSWIRSEYKKKRWSQNSQESHLYYIGQVKEAFTEMERMGEDEAWEK